MESCVLQRYVQSCSVISFAVLLTLHSQVVADMIIFEPPMLGVFFVSTGLLGGNGKQQVFNETRHQLWPTYLIDLGVWVPLQIVNFRFCPVPWQPIVVYTADVGWNAYLSFVKFESSRPSLSERTQDRRTVPSLDVVYS
jgi:hypothetical protein